MKRENKIILIIMLISFVGILLLSNTITGNVVLEEITINDNFEYLPPSNLTRESALMEIDLAKRSILTMKSSNFGTYFVNDLLIESETAYNYSNYEIVFRNTQLIKYTKEQTFRIFDTISILEEKELQYAKEGINTTLAREYLEQGKISFKEERYNEAEAFLKETDLKLEDAKSEQTRIKGLINLSKNFFLRHWLSIIIILSLFIISSPYFYKYSRKRIAKRRLNNLKLELNTLNGLLKTAQEDAFKKKVVPMSVFKIRSDRYKERIAEIRHIIPVLESIVYNKKRK